MIWEQNVCTKIRAETFFGGGSFCFVLYGSGIGTVSLCTEQLLPEDCHCILCKFADVNSVNLNARWHLKAQLNTQSDKTSGLALNATLATMVSWYPICQSTLSTYPTSSPLGGIGTDLGCQCDRIPPAFFAQLQVEFVFHLPNHISHWGNVYSGTSDLQQRHRQWSGDRLRLNA